MITPNDSTCFLMGKIIITKDKHVVIVDDCDVISKVVGFEFATRVRLLGITCPIIFFSAENEGATVHEEKIKEIGNAIFVSKSAQYSYLMGTVNKFLSA